MPPPRFGDPLLHRRALMASTIAGLLAGAGGAGAVTISGSLPWQPDAGDAPVQVLPGPWQFFTAEEGAAVEALVDRLIPPDPETPGGKDAGVAVLSTANWPARTAVRRRSTCARRLPTARRSRACNRR